VAYYEPQTRLLALGGGGCPRKPARGESTANPPAITMKLSQTHACPRCLVALAVSQSGDQRSHRVVLVCPEAYCDYVLVVDERTSTPAAARWRLPDIGWFKRAAS